MTRGMQVRGLCALLVLVAGVAGCTNAPDVRRRVADAPIAVALTGQGQRAYLSVVDLESGEVIRRTRLRSMAGEIDGDSRTRTVVTAQCGGLGRDTDVAAGVYDTETGRIDYVDLEVPNPLSVAVEGSEAVLAHGFWQDQGACMSRVNIARRTLTEKFHIADTAAVLFRQGDALLTGLTKGEGAAPRTTLFDVSKGASESVEASVPLCAVRAVEGAPRTTVIGLDSMDTSDGHMIYEFSADGSVRRQAHIEGLKKVPIGACRFGDRIAVADADGIDPADPGRRVVMLDAETFEPRGSIEVEGMPASLDAWGDKLLVLDPLSGELLIYGPDGGEPTKRIELGPERGFTADLVVFP